MQVAQGPASPPIRQHARVSCHDVAAGVKIEGTEEWIQVGLGDLSLGGAFIVTDRFIVEGTQLDVGLAFPSGMRLFFGAEVVRAVSESARGPAGLGLQFLPATPENTRALARELDARTQAAPPVAAPPQSAASAPAAGPAGPAPAPAPAAAGIELTTTIYERLRLPPDCDDTVLGASLERLIASVDQSLPALPEGRQRDQALVFKQTLERMRPICQDPLKRAAYDFNNGIARVEERVAAAASGQGPPLVKLQEVWKRIFPNEVREAKRLLVEARKGGPDAERLYAEARALDPFQPQLQPGLVAQTPPVMPVTPPAPAVSPSPFGAPPTPAAPATAQPPMPTTPAPQPTAPQPTADDDLPLVEPDDFFGGLE